MKRAISAMLAAIMLSTVIVLPAAAADSGTVTAYFEDFESGSRGNIQTVNVNGTPAAELSVVDYKTYDGTTSKVLKVKSNGYSGNPAFMYDPADAPVGGDGLRISFDFYMDSDTYKTKKNNENKNVSLMWSENKAVNSGKAYWFTVAGTWQADNDNKTFAGTGIKSCTGTWWRLIQDYDFKNKRYSVSITDLSTGDIYGSYYSYLSSIKTADDKFDRAAIILPVKDSVTYIDNFSCLPLNRLDVDFGAETNEIEIGEGTATVRAFDGWITAVAVDNAAQKLAYAKNESAAVDLSALLEGKHKLTTTVSYNDGTSKKTDTSFLVINNRAVYVDENFDDYSTARTTANDGGVFADNKQALVAKGVLSGDNLDFAQVCHKADGLTENIRGASGEKDDYALKIGVTSTDDDAEDFYDGFQIEPAQYVTDGQFVIEMDAMASADTQVRLEGMAQDNGELFTRDGGMLGNRAATEYVPDKWKKLRIECDYENTADFCRDGNNVAASDVYIGKVYYDNKYIGMIRLDPNNRWLQITVNGDVGGYLAVDNLRIYKWTDILHLHEGFDSYEGGALPSDLELDARDCSLSAAAAVGRSGNALSLTASGDDLDPDYAPALIATLPSTIGQNALISMDVNIQAADTDDRLFGFYIMDKNGYSCFDASNFAVSGNGDAGIYQDESARIETGKWYRLNIAIDLLGGVYSARLTDTSTGDTTYAAVDAALNDGAVSEISTVEINMLGSGEVLLDNISVLGDAPVSNSFEIISPKEGSARSISCFAVNAPSEFAALEFILDGKIIRTFRGGNKSHIYRAGTEFVYGRHTFEALLTDKNGNCKSESVDFEITLNGVNPLKGLTCINNGIENGYLSEVPYNAQGLKLYLNTGLKGSSVNTDTVSVYSGGKRISLEGVSYDEGEKSVTALLNEMLLPTGGEMRIDGAALDSGALLERSIKGEFSATASDAFICGAQILKDGNAIDSKYQLADNAEISVRTNILNPTHQRRSAVLAAAVYSSGRLTGVRTESVTVEPMHKSDVIIENMKYSENAVVKTMLLDGFDSMRPLGMQITAAASGDVGLSEEPLLEYDFETERDYDKLPKGNTIAEEKDENGNTYVLYERTKLNSDGAYNDCFTDITMPTAAAYTAIDADSYVVECDIRVDELNTDASLRGIDVITYKSSAGTWGSPLLRIDGNGGIRLGDSVIGQMNTDGEWTRLSLLYNNKTAKLSCFKNGICIADGFDFDPSFLPALYRIGVQINGGNVIFGMDNFRIYKADKPTNFVVKRGNGYESVMESAIQAVQTVGVNDFVLMVNNGAYLARRVKKTSRVLPYIDNDTVMMPITLCGECFGSEASQSGKSVLLGENVKMTVGGTDLTVGSSKYTLSQPVTERDNVVYIPLEDVAEKAFGKHYYWDDRGFAVVSASEFTLRNSDAVEILDEPIDTLYRYLQFERPSGSQLIAAIEENNPNNKHPRVLATADDIAAMRENISKDETMASWAENVVAYADSYAKTAGQIKPPAAGASMLSQSKDALDRVRNYAGAYFITGDEGYAEYAWTELDNVCTEFESWGDTSSFLDTAEMAYAFAIGYDSFYDLFTEAQKKQLRDTVVKNAFEPGLVAYKGKHPNGYWINGDDNWTAVCPGGLMSAAIAMADEDDTREICENILGCTVQSFEYVMSLLYPDGGWYESMGYFDYTVEYLYAGIGSLINATGSDWGLFNVPGAENSCAYTLYLHGLIGGSFNYHDGGGSKWGNMITGPEMLWFAKQTGQLWYGERYVKLHSILEKKLSKQQVPKLDITALLNYLPDWQSGEELPLDNYFRQTEAGTMRQNWSENATFVGVHAGRNGVDHDHLDLGEFVFEADGVRWVNDFGADDYSLPNYFKEYNIYLKRPEANNCYIINPREDFPGQRTKCSTKLLKRESADDRAFMTFDLTQAYADDASSAIRGFLLDDDRRTLLIRDEIELKESSEIDWFMNMNAWPDGNRPAYTVDGNTITFRNGTETLRVELLTNADSYEFIVMNREPLFSSTVMGKAANETKNFPKLRIKLNGEGKLYIAVKLIPGSADDATGISDTPISQW